MPKQRITPAQLASTLEILDVRIELVGDRPTKKDCFNYHRDYKCKNKVTHFAIAEKAQIRCCSDTYCQLNAAVSALFFSLPAKATRSLRRISKISAALNRTMVAESRASRH